jgi:PIN domain nuclease of toxin-antitoxin system
MPMNSFLLDTHVLLWWLKNSDELGTTCRRTIATPDNEIYVSPISLWEISIKKSIGKLKAPGNLVEICKQKGFSPLSFILEDGQAMESLPYFHRDPFDRMLIIQAINNDLTIITSDDVIKNYDVKILSAHS